MTLLYSAFKNQYAAISYLLMTSVSRSYASHEPIFTRVFRRQSPIPTTHDVSLGPQIEVMAPGVPSRKRGKLGMRIACSSYLLAKLLAETMHDVSNDLVPSNLKDLFVPTAKIHSHNTRASVSKNFYIQKSNTEIQRKSVSRIGAQLWNEIPTKLRALPKATFKKRIQMILLKILENEDSYKDVEFIISKVNCYFP